MKKNQENKLYEATDIDIQYDDISFDLGYLSYLVPNALIKTESMN